MNCWRADPWRRPRDAFQASLAAAGHPGALEGLGLAAWWLDDARLVFDARERACKLYSMPGIGAPPLDSRSGWRGTAGRFAAKPAVANGWLQRARRHLDGLPESPRLAWLEARESQFALAEDGDPDRAHRHAAEATRVGRATGAVDYEMLGRSLQGLALVSSGAVAEGMKLLDEVNAAVVAGELTDQIAIGLASCYMIAACERVRDSRPRRAVVHAAEGVLREMGTASAVCGMPHAVRVGLHVARHLARGRAGADRRHRRTGRRRGRP